jgi:hypothetical protein
MERASDCMVSHCSRTPWILCSGSHISKARSVVDIYAADGVHPSVSAIELFNCVGRKYIRFSPRSFQIGFGLGIIPVLIKGWVFVNMIELEINKTLSESSVLVSS